MSSLCRNPSRAAHAKCRAISCDTADQELLAIPEPTGGTDGEVIEGYQAPTSAPNGVASGVLEPHLWITWIRQPIRLYRKYRMSDSGIIPLIYAIWSGNPVGLV